MSVYVDDLRDCPRNKNWPYDKCCHFVADCVEELHYFAGRLRLKPSWFQEGVCSLPHYDLTAGMRKRAISLGAIEMCDAKLVAMIKENRQREARKTDRPRSAGH